MTRAVPRKGGRLFPMLLLSPRSSHSVKTQVRLLKPRGDTQGCKDTTVGLVPLTLIPLPSTSRI